MISENKTKYNVVSLQEVAKKVCHYKDMGKKVVLSFGVFDIIHPGILQHLNEAREMGDVLVVAVLQDKDVKRGPGRPIFTEELRAKNVAALKQVDLTCVVENEIPFEFVKMINPDIFAKGQAYLERDKKIHENLFKQEKELYLGKIKIKETNGFTFSSSEIINNFLDIYPDSTKRFIKKIEQKYSLDESIERIKRLNDLNVLLIGDGIIDEYHYCSSMGKSAKAHLVVSKYLSHEVFAGGAFAIANHLAGICGKVKLITLLGTKDNREKFIDNSLKPNIERKYFYRKDGPSIIKKRYVNEYLNQKLFEINYLNEQYIDKVCETRICKYLSAELPKYDIVLVSDFGHGFITEKIIRTIEKFSKKVAVNTQTNSANMGFNIITKYAKPNFVCLDEVEARLTMQNRFDDIGKIATRLFQELGSDMFVVTLGKKGSLGISKDDGLNYTPIFSSKIIDTVGAGDAVFSYAAACYAKNYPLDFITFIGNAVGAIAVQIICNKKSVERYELLEFLNVLFKQNGMKITNENKISQICENFINRKNREDEMPDLIKKHNQQRVKQEMN